MGKLSGHCYPHASKEYKMVVFTGYVDPSYTLATCKGVMDKLFLVGSVIQSILRIADTLVHRPLLFIWRMSFIQVLGLYHLLFARDNI